MSPLVESGTFLGIVPRKDWKPVENNKVLHEISLDELERKILVGAPTIVAKVTAKDPDTIQLEVLELSASLATTPQPEVEVLYVARPRTLERDNINLLFEGRNLNSPGKRHPVRIKWESET